VSGQALGRILGIRAQGNDHHAEEGMYIRDAFVRLLRRIIMANFYQDVIMKDPRFHSKNPVADPNLLEPVTRAAVEAIIDDAAAHGISLMIFETYRSQERQALLFEQKATQLRTVGVHHYGLACDIVKSINGVPSWKGDFSFLGPFAKAHGLIWGGDWGTPNILHTFHDMDHVQRCSVAMQAGLFRGDFYPDADYNPFGEQVFLASETTTSTAQG
jgi:hypothetical protein